MNWVIRSAVAADAAELSKLAEQTFRVAFSDLNTPENMDLHCSSSYSTSIQAAEIVNPAVDTIVAESQGRLVGFAQMHFDPDSPDCVTLAPSVELRRIYVDRSFHGTGLAHDLMARVLQTAAIHDSEALWLGVWEQNPRAIRFYGRLGFSEVGDHAFLLGNDPQRDLIMVRRLRTSQ